MSKETTTTETTTTTQSIFITLDTLKTETSVPGQTPKMQPHTLPREQFPSSKQFEQETELLAWAKDAGILHAVLQKGVRAHLIDCRARFKACKKGDAWTNEYGQKNLDSYKWEVQTRPSGGNKVDKARESGHLAAGQAMAQAMKDNGMEFEVIQTNITTVYGPEVAAEILANLT
jgi:hypothetical protein